MDDLLGLKTTSVNIECLDAAWAEAGRIAFLESVAFGRQSESKRGRGSEDDEETVCPSQNVFHALAAVVHRLSQAFLS